MATDSMSDTPDTTRLSDPRATQRRIDLYTATIGELREYIIEWEGEYNQLAEMYIAQGLDLGRVEAERDRCRKALDTVIAEAGAIWDDNNPVHPAHGTGLDMMLFAARAALHNAAAGRDHAGKLPS